MSVTTKTMTYNCTGKITRLHEGFVKFGHFPSGVNHNCEISLLIETKTFAEDGWFVEQGGIKLKGKSTLDILVQKTDETPAKVDIKLEIIQEGSHYRAVMDETKSVDDWKTSCYFKDCPIWFTLELPLKLRMEIVWTLPTANMPINVSNFLMNKTFSDVNIVIGGEKLSAHKVILGACSPVFMEILTSPKRKVVHNSIEIDDVEVDVMKAILRFLYTGEIGDLENADMALKALVAAKKYDMKELSEVCEQKLLANLSTANVLQILDVADTHRSETLVKETKAFIVDNKKEIVGVEYFEEICTKKPRLMMDFMRAIV